MVIRGAKKSLEEKKIGSILLEFIVEFMEDMNENPQWLVDHLEQMGFALHEIEPDGLLGKRLDARTIVDERRVSADAPMRPFNEINLVAVLQH